MRILQGKEDEEFLDCVKQLEVNVPWLFKNEKFNELLASLRVTMMQCRIYYLITETCLAFDPEETGKIRLSELKESLTKVIGEEASTKMLAQCHADDEGHVYYPQVASILSKGVVAAPPPAGDQKKD